jgi:hypothetical protein
MRRALPRRCATDALELRAGHHADPSSSTSPSPTFSYFPARLGFMALPSVRATLMTLSGTRRPYRAPDAKWRKPCCNRVGKAAEIALFELLARQLARHSLAHLDRRHRIPQSVVFEELAAVQCRTLMRGSRREGLGQRRSSFTNSCVCTGNNIRPSAYLRHQAGGRLRMLPGALKCCAIRTPGGTACPAAH